MLSSLLGHPDDQPPEEDEPETEDAEEEPEEEEEEEDEDDRPNIMRALSTAGKHYAMKDQTKAIEEMEKALTRDQNDVDAEKRPFIHTMPSL